MLIRGRALHWFVGCVLLPAAATATEQADLQRLGTSVFRIEARDNFGRLHSGSSVMVGANTLVTNCHTVSNAQEIHVAGVSGRISARLVRANTERNLCLLDVPRLKGTVVTLGSTADKRAGERVIAVGFPAGAALALSHGHIEGLFAYQGSGRVVQGSAPFSPGKSGGGLFDEQGSLIGILTFKCRAGGPYHFSVPAEWAITLMREASTTTNTLTDKPFWQHPAEQQPMFLRAASLFADGDCIALNQLTAEWPAREPDNPDAIFMARRARLCNLLEQIQRPLLEK